VCNLMSKITAEKNSIEHALHDGLITAKTASALSAAADRDLDALQAVWRQSRRLPIHSRE
jgi:hypothetical protein